MKQKIKNIFKYNILLIFFACIMFFVGTNSPAILILLAILLLLFFSESALRMAIYSSLTIASLAIVFIVLSMVAQTVTFLKMVSPLDFFFGSVWHPNLTIYDGQLVKLFGILPLLFGTLLIAFIATAIALPIGLFSAVCITYFTSKKQRNIIKPLIEAMAGIPTVIYGYFALNFISPVLQFFAEYFGKTIPTESALFAGLIVGMMMMPLVTSLVDDVLHSVPKGLYYGGAALGSTKTEIIVNIMLPYAFPGILSVILLAFSRALGETMIVLMLAGTMANFTLNPLQPVTTITVQIVTLLTGDQTFNSKESMSAYALGLSLFVLTLVLNAIAINMAKRYRA